MNCSLPLINQNEAAVILSRYVIVINAIAAIFIFDHSSRHFLHLAFFGGHVTQSKLWMLIANEISANRIIGRMALGHFLAFVEGAL